MQRLLTTIRPETTGDVATIARVVEAAFGSPAEARLVERIRASPEHVPALALVAEVDGEVVGHVMVSYATLVRRDGGEGRIAMLSPLAVDPVRQARGIGAALVHEAVTGAERLGEPCVVLEGSPAYYGRLGFEPSAGHGITLPLPDWAPPEAAQIMRLVAWDPALAGAVRYPPAFDGL